MWQEGVDLAGLPQVRVPMGYSYIVKVRLRLRFSRVFGFGFIGCVGEVEVGLRTVPYTHTDVYGCNGCTGIFNMY